MQLSRNELLHNLEVFVTLWEQWRYNGVPYIILIKMCISLCFHDACCDDSLYCLPSERIRYVRDTSEFVHALSLICRQWTHFMKTQRRSRSLQRYVVHFIASVLSEVRDECWNTVLRNPGNYSSSLSFLSIRWNRIANAFLCILYIWKL